MKFETHTLIVGLLLATLSSSLWAAEKGAAGKSSGVEQAVQAYQAGDYAQAATHFKRVVQLEPANAKAWLFLGQSLAQSNDNMGARRAFAKVLALQSSGPVAERAGEQLAKLPEPDLFTLQLDSGLTLGDWLPIAQQQAAQGKRDAVLGEISQHLKRFGPVPQLLVMQEQFNKEIQAEQEQRLQGAIAALKVKDADSAKTALPQIRALKRQAPGNLTLLKLEAKACHLLQDWAGAEAAYSVWLKAAPGNDAQRKGMVAGLMKVKQREALPPPPQPFEMVAIQGKNYEIGKYEVTQGEWQSVMGSNPSRFAACGEDCPVENVSWNDVQEFITKLNQQTGNQYRLPTEQEWEFACLGGRSTEYCGGNDLNALGWYNGNSGATSHPVGQKQANAYGLYDMSGNVWEWVQDKYDSQHDWRVLRGGSWGIDPRNARAANRGGSDPA